MRRAFTLIELIVVVAILAALAGSAVAVLGNVQEGAGRDLARAEAAAIREAVLRFHADTGWLPGEGPFDLVARGGGAVVPEGQEWFDSAANLTQLLERPTLTGSAAALATWDPDRRRGWNGPYLTTSTEGRVQVRFVDGRAAPDASAQLDGPGALLPLAPAIADPFVAPCGAAGGAFHWVEFADPTRSLGQQGRPYLLLLPRDPAAPPPAPVLRDQARVVGLGPDGALDAPTSIHPDDVVQYLFR